MQVQYQLNLDDIVAASLHYARTSQNSRRRIRQLQIFGIIIALTVALQWPRWDLGVGTLFPAAYSLFLIFGFPAYYRSSVKRNARRLYSGEGNKGALGNHIISIDEAGITEISDVGDSRTAWGGVERVEEDEGYIFLYTGSIQAHVIPKQAFLSAGEAADFLQLAKAYRLAAALETTSMIFVFSDDRSLSVISKPDYGEFEGVDVENGVYRFFDKDGTYLKPVFTKPNETGHALGFIPSVASGEYEFQAVPDSDEDLFFYLDRAISLEPNEWFHSLDEVRRFLKR